MKIVIVGGGISGWLSALLFPLRQPYHEYVIVESPEVKTIGVGEGTTGLFMTQVINDYFGTPVQEFLRETKATPKIGIEFNDWKEIGSTYFNPIDGTDTRDHPFDSSLYFSHIQNSELDSSSVHGLMKKNKKSPFYKTSGELKYYDTALHLDNELTIEYLKKKALNSEKLSYISDTVSEIIRKPNGDVEKIICSDNVIEGDIFVDCTGFARIFSDNSDWVSFKENLPMNSVTTFTRDHSGNVDMLTKANALSAGWSWEIPTQERYGCGYVNCDSFIDQNEVEKEILSIYPDAEIKNSFKFDSGKLKKSWNNNVISLGLSYHFLEPLQATNIHMTVVQIDTLCTKYIRDTKERTINDHIKSSYNRTIDNLIENFKHYINAHWSSSRNDTEFWKYISKKEHLTDFTKEIIGLIKTRGLFSSDFPSLYGGTGTQLWGYTMLGLGHATQEDSFKFLKELGFYEVGMNSFFNTHNTIKQLPLLTYKQLIDRIKVNKKYEILA